MLQVWRTVMYSADSIQLIKVLNKIYKMSIVQSYTIFTINEKKVSSSY